jgi:ribose transport system substrate-binding protein
MDRTRITRLFGALAGATLAVSSVGGALAQDSSPAAASPAAASPAAAGSPAAGGGTYTIGVSNTVAGNGWREQMICSIKAQAVSSGQVESLNIAHRNTDSAGQLEDIRNLIAAGVDAIIINASDREALNAAIAEATGAGIVVVAVDSAVTEPSAYVLENNQAEYARLGAEWLFEKLGGEGNVFYMRGLAGHSADDDRDTGFKEAQANYPGITIVGEVFTDWQQDTGKQQMLDMIASGQQVDGVWTSGIDNVVVEAFVESGAPLVPIVGADNAGFVNQLATVEGLEGAAVTNPGTVGGAGVTLALQILNGERPATPADEESRFVRVDPTILANDTEEGQAAIEAAQVEGLDPEWPVGLTIEGWTTYTPDELIACRGPGE